MPTTTCTCRSGPRDAWSWQPPLACARELQGDARLRDYRRALLGETQLYDEWAQQYGFQIALSESGSSFDRYLRGFPQWELVRETRPASLYRRRLPT